MQTPTRFGKLLNIDTGAFAQGRALTFYDVNNDRCLQVKESSDDVIITVPVVVDNFV